MKLIYHIFVSYTKNEKLKTLAENEMNCQKIKKLLNPYIDQALDAETAQQVEEHLKSCPACRQEYRRLKEIATSLNSFPQVSAPQNIT
ncbi:hypothetical protein ES708_18909 [subsurface metagenome]